MKKFILTIMLTILVLLGKKWMPCHLSPTQMNWEKEKFEFLFMLVYVFDHDNEYLQKPFYYCVPNVDFKWMTEKEAELHNQTLKWTGKTPAT